VRLGVVVYTDDYQGFDYVLTALANQGLGYDLYYGDPAGFETAVASGAYDLIIVNHDSSFELSYAWDDIYNELLAGKKAIIMTFDCDGSNDYSGGFMASLLGLAGLTWNADVGTATTLYGWIESPDFWQYMPAGAVPVHPDDYYDEGDAVCGDTTPAICGWTDSPDQCEIAVSFQCCELILGCVLLDEYAEADAIRFWENCIRYMAPEGCPVEESTWSVVKAIYG